MARFTVGQKALAAFEDAARPTATSQLVTVESINGEWVTVRLSDGRTATVGAACIS